MMKCDMCYDRTSIGLTPMCASVCPSGALFYGTSEEVERQRRRSRPVNEFQFGGQTIRTKVNMIPESVNEVRVVDIVGLDKQADGGTHVRSTDEVGRVRVVKTESKGKGNKRIRIEIVDA